MAAPLPWQPRLRDAAVGAGCRFFSLPFKFGVHGRHTVRQPCRVVIIKTGSVGDVLMATAAVRAFRRCLPHAHLAFAVGAWSRAMVKGNTRLDATIDLGTLGGRGYRRGDYFAAVKRLRAGRYDTAIVLDRAPLISLIAYLAGIPLRVGLDSEGRGFSLNVGVPCPPRHHEVDLYLDVVRAAGCAVEDPRLEFFPSDEDHAAAAALVADAGRQLSPDVHPLLVAIHPGGGVNPGMTLLAKRWPASRFADVADRLQRELDATVVLVGGPDDRAVVNEVRALLRGPAIDVAGRLSWGQLGALLQRCRLLVANDTGAAHLSAAVGTPAVVVFGPSDPAQYGPYGELGEAVSAGVPCSPCFQRGRVPPCHNGHRCLVDLEVAAVWAAILRWWPGNVAADSPAGVIGGGH